MALFKWQWFFEADTGEGFSETYWDAASTSITVSSGKSETLLGDRLALLTNKFYCRYAKVHDTGTPKSALLSINHLGEPGSFTPVTGTDAHHQVEECVLLSYHGERFVNVHKYLHGIGEWVSQGETLNMAPAWEALLTTFINNFKTSCVINRTPPPDVFAPPEPIIDCQPQKVTTHRVGRPFGMSVGRRTTHASRLTRAERLLTSKGIAIPQRQSSGTVASP